MAEVYCQWTPPRACTPEAAAVHTAHSPSHPSAYTPAWLRCPVYTLMLDASARIVAAPGGSLASPQGRASDRGLSRVQKCLPLSHQCRPLGWPARQLPAAQWPLAATARRLRARVPGHRAAGRRGHLQPPLVAVGAYDRVGSTVDKQGGLRAMITAAAAALQLRVDDARTPECQKWLVYSWAA